MSTDSDIVDFITGTEREMERVFRAAALAVMTGIVNDTPVLDGYLRGGWLIGVGEEPAGDGGGRQDASGGTVLTHVAAGVMQATHSDTIYFANRLPYAYRVEYEGWSHTKAPEGMVRRNTSRWDEIVREVSRAPGR